MKPMAFKTTFALVLFSFVLLPFAAWATVDYDSVDEAALTMAAQTDVIQASDQFIRAYDQLLVYDHDEFSSDYNYQNLIGSISAGSTVLFIDGDGEGLRFWTGSTTWLAYLNLGYDEDSTKSVALTGDCLSLSNALHRIRAAISCGWDGLIWCWWDEGIKPAAVAAWALASDVGYFIAAGQGGALLYGGAVILVTWEVVCALIADHDFLWTLCFGSVFLGSAGSYRRRRPTHILTRR
jgi:hypothetical protein